MSQADITPQMASEAATPSKRLDQVRARIRARHYSIRIEDQYVFRINRFVCFHGKRHPRGVGSPLVRL